MKMRYSLVLILGLALAAAASGQTAVEGLPGKKPPAPAPVPLQETDARLIEILVELAWLSDPLTFPFYLEARVEGNSLRVRGNVPSKSVHEHALKLAQMNTPLPLVDDLKENPRLKVQPTRMTPDQLEKVVRAALRQSQPGLAKNLQIHCTADGQVALTGNVDTFEQKLAVSQALRRLHGCTVALNHARVGYDPDGSLARSLSHPPVPAQTVSTTSVMKDSPLGATAAAGDNSNSSLTPPPVVVLTPAKDGAPRLGPAQLQKRIQAACPKAREVRVTLLPSGEHKIEIRVRQSGDDDVCFRQVFSIPGVDAYHPVLFFVIESPPTK